MNPFQIARELYRNDPDDLPSFEEAMMAHLIEGIVIATDEVFLMARPVRTDCEVEEFDNPWISYEDPDCWHVYLAAGTIQAIRDALPYPLPFLSFVRKNHLHIRNLKHMSRLSGHGKSSEKTHRTGECSHGSGDAAVCPTGSKG
jgi:hypothetical protein